MHLETDNFIVWEGQFPGRPFFGRIRHPLFDQVIYPEAGISKEIFRNRTYFASVRISGTGGNRKVFSA